MARAFLVFVVLLNPGCAEVRPGFRPEEAPWSRDTAPPVPRGHLRVTLDIFEVPEKDRDALQGAGKFAAPEVAVSGGATFEVHGFRVIPGQETMSASIHADLRRAATVKARTIFMVAVPGEPSRLELFHGATVLGPVSVPIFKDRAKVGTVEIEPAAGGFAMKAKRLSKGLLEVRLAPWFVAPSGKETVIEEAAADLVLDPGRPYAILAKTDAAETVGSVTLSKGSGPYRRCLLVVLTVEDP
ncbi:MAG TPA: hypothetical protein VJU16_01120 [Planctomycetota bacterium]|nr:hypothetical protein [Planctomycetota bacterium]